MELPDPRGPVSENLLALLDSQPRAVGAAPRPDGDPLDSDDAQLALYVLYELHYRSFDGVDDGWEWHPGLIELRAGLERAFEQRLREEAGAPRAADPADMDLQLRAILDADDGPSVGRHLGGRGTLEQFRELVVHRSAYHLKEADPHTWALPRLAGRPKAALVEIQADEYGDGDESRMHSTLFGDLMEELALSRTYGAYLDHLPGSTLATVNLMSMFGLHRRWRGAIVGHLAGVEMTSSQPSRRYANALRRHGIGPRATRFYDEHVEADAVHESIAANDLAGGLARESPDLAGDILFGARALLAVERRMAERLLGSWQAGESSLLRPVAGGVAAAA